MKSEHSPGHRYRVLNRILALPLWGIVLLATALLALGYALPDRFRATSRPFLVASAVALYVGWFRFHLGAVCVLAALCAAPLRRWRLAGAGLIVGLVALAPTLPLYLPKHAPPDGRAGRTLKLASMNLQGENRDGGRILAQIRAADPDVLLIQEFTPFQQELLEKNLAGDYPHRLLFPHDGYDGMAVYSRSPIRLESAPTINVPGWPTRVVKAVVSVGDRDVALWSAHLMAVSNLEQIERNRHETADLIDAIQAEERPLILAGDFNFTDTTANAAAFVRAGLSDTAHQAGTGRRSTWPSSGWQRRIGVRIDHVYVSPQFAADEDDAGEETGSDHRPISVRLRLR